MAGNTSNTKTGGTGVLRHLKPIDHALDNVVSPKKAKTDQSVVTVETRHESRLNKDVAVDDNETTFTGLDPDAGVTVALVEQIAERQAASAVQDRAQFEAVRAVHRNRNRLIALLVVLLSELLLPIIVLPYIHVPPHYANQALILLITIPDAFVTLYAYIRRY